MIDLTSRLFEALETPITSDIRGKSGFYPSSASIDMPDGTISGSCLRQQYYRWMDCAPTDKGDIEWKITSMVGEALHKTVGWMFREMSLGTNLTLIREEQSFFDKDHMLSGRIDLLLYDAVSDAVMGCDIKTVGEFAASISIDQPRLKDILQCTIYLDQYQKHGNKTKHPLKEWAILYLARTESWRLKKYPHGSPFKYMWQFSLFLDEVDNHVIVENQYGERTHYEYITPEKIYARYGKLKDYIKSDSLPPRDFEHTYSEERIVGMFKEGKIKYKKDLTVIDKWLAKGAEAGELGLDMGDFECRYCDFKSLCWSDRPEDIVTKKKELYDLGDTSSIIIPTEPQTTMEVQSETDFI
jgi:hypothetical protein